MNIYGIEISYTPNDILNVNKENKEFFDCISEYELKRIQRKQDKDSLKAYLFNTLALMDSTLSSIITSIEKATPSYIKIIFTTKDAIKGSALNMSNEDLSITEIIILGGITIGIGVASAVIIPTLIADAMLGFIASIIISYITTFFLSEAYLFLRSKSIELWQDAKNLAKAAMQNIMSLIQSDTRSLEERKEALTEKTANAILSSTNKALMTQKEYEEHMIFLCKHCYDLNTTSHSNPHPKSNKTRNFQLLIKDYASLKPLKNKHIELINIDSKKSLKRLTNNKGEALFVINEDERGDFFNVRLIDDKEYEQEPFYLAKENLKNSQQRQVYLAKEALINSQNKQAYLAKEALINSQQNQATQKILSPNNYANHQAIIYFKKKDTKVKDDINLVEELSFLEYVEWELDPKTKEIKKAKEKIKIHYILDPSLQETRDVFNATKNSFNASQDFANITKTSFNAKQDDSHTTQDVFNATQTYSKTTQTSFYVAKNFSHTKQDLTHKTQNSFNTSQAPSYPFAPGTYIELRARLREDMRATRALNWAYLSLKDENELYLFKDKKLAKYDLSPLFDLSGYFNEHQIYDKIGFHLPLLNCAYVIIFASTADIDIYKNTHLIINTKFKIGEISKGSIIEAKRKEDQNYKAFKFSLAKIEAQKSNDGLLASATKEALPYFNKLDLICNLEEAVNFLRSNKDKFSEFYQKHQARYENENSSFDPLFDYLRAYPSLAGKLAFLYKGFDLANEDFVGSVMRSCYVLFNCQDEYKANRKDFVEKIVKIYTSTRLNSSFIDKLYRVNENTRTYKQEFEAVFLHNDKNIDKFSLIEDFINEIAKALKIKPSLIPQLTYELSYGNSGTYDRNTNTISLSLPRSGLKDDFIALMDTLIHEFRHFYMHYVFAYDLEHSLTQSKIAQFIHHSLYISWGYKTLFDAYDKNCASFDAEIKQCVKNSKYSEVRIRIIDSKGAQIRMKPSPLYYIQPSERDCRVVAGAFRKEANL